MLRNTISLYRKSQSSKRSSGSVSRYSSNSSTAAETSNDDESLEELLNKIQTQYEQRFADVTEDPTTDENLKEQKSVTTAKETKQKAEFNLADLFDVACDSIKKGDDKSAAKVEALDHSIDKVIEQKATKTTPRNPPFRAIETCLLEFRPYFPSATVYNRPVSSTRTPLHVLLSSLSNDFHRPDLAISMFELALKREPDVHESLFQSKVWNELLHATYETTKSCKAIEQRLRIMWKMGIPINEGAKTVTWKCMNDLMSCGTNAFEERHEFKHLLKKYKII
jgi:hypothetical protein